MTTRVQKPAPPKTSRPPLWVVVALVTILLLSGVYAYILYAPCDDTYIYLVYAKNLFAGDGLTFNGMKVQGAMIVLYY